jgi:predicted secreted protein
MNLRLLVLSVTALAQIGLVAADAHAASRSNRTLSLSVGASKTIVLSENPSTGYAWQVDTAGSSNLAIVRVNDAGYQPAQNGLIGAPGSHRWQIEAQAPGIARIVFAYARAWEHVAPAKSHSVEVNVAQGR